jgi:hypothetical protein
MPGAIRPNKEAMKIAYEILKTPKEQQQKDHEKPSKKTVEIWAKDSSKTTS